MQLQILTDEFVVCQLRNCDTVDWRQPFTFFARTDTEISYVCPASAVPRSAFAVEEGWRGMRLSGTLDFSLIGVLAKIAAVLAAKEISIFVISTFATDYIFVKKERFDDAVAALKEDGYEIELEMEKENKI